MERVHDREVTNSVLHDGSVLEYVKARRDKKD